jgi:hypothetical protein
VAGAVSSNPLQISKTTRAILTKDRGEYCEVAGAIEQVLNFYLAHQLDLRTGITESFSHSRPVLAIAGPQGLSREAQLGDKNVQQDGICSFSCNSSGHRPSGIGRDQAP